MAPLLLADFFLNEPLNVSGFLSEKWDFSQGRGFWAFSPSEFLATSSPLAPGEAESGFHGFQMFKVTFDL